MNKPITLLMCMALAIVSVACNLSTSAGTDVELTQPADQIIPTATTELTSVITEVPTLVTEEPEPTVVNQPVNNSGGSNSGQIPPTAVLPEVTLPLLDAPGQPPVSECTVSPANAGILINVRRGADLDYDAFMQLKTYASVIADVNGWYQIPLDGGFSGYVSSTVTKLNGNCAFLYPEPFPTRIASECYFDIPLMAGDEVPYFNEPQQYGNQKQGDIATAQLLIRGEKAGWYEVISHQGVRGWVPAGMGQTFGSCNDIPSITYDVPICIVVAVYDGSAYDTPFSGADQFGVIPAGEGLGAVARTTTGWYGFDPGISQAPNEGLDRLRWVYPNHTNLFQAVGDCNSIPFAYDESADWDIAIDVVGDPPTDGCSVQSTTQPFENYIYTGLENPSVVGVLNTHAPFVSFGDLGHVIELPDGSNGWVSRDSTRLVGTACPIT